MESKQNSTLVSKPRAETDTKPEPAKPVPDRATIGALLMMTKLDHEQRQNKDGHRKTPWWSLAEWTYVSPAVNKRGAIKLVLILGTSIALSIFTDYFINHHGFNR